LLDADESFGGSCAGAWKIIYPIDLATSDRTMFKKSLWTKEKKFRRNFLTKFRHKTNA